jgi:predicted metalloprotease with PDZ domain
MTRLVRGLVASTLALAPVTAFAQGTPQAPSDTTYAPHAGQHTANAPRLGVALMQLTPELRVFFAVPADRGVIVAKVVPGSPAAKAGVKVGDVIVAVQSEPIANGREVQSAVSAAKPDARVEVDVIRNKKHVKLSAKLGATTPDTMQQDTMRQDATTPDTTTPQAMPPDATGERPAPGPIEQPRN